MYRGYSAGGLLRGCHLRGLVSHHGRLRAGVTDICRTTIRTGMDILSAMATRGCWGWCGSNRADRRTVDRTGIGSRTGCIHFKIHPEICRCQRICGTGCPGYRRKRSGAAGGSVPLQIVRCTRGRNCPGYERAPHLRRSGNRTDAGQGDGGDRDRHGNGLAIHSDSDRPGPKRGRSKHRGIRACRGGALRRPKRAGDPADRVRYRDPVRDMAEGYGICTSGIVGQVNLNRNVLGNGDRRRRRRCVEDQPGRIGKCPPEEQARRVAVAAPPVIYGTSQGTVIGNRRSVLCGIAIEPGEGNGLDRAAIIKDRTASVCRAAGKHGVGDGLDRAARVIIDRAAAIGCRAAGKRGVGDGRDCAASMVDRAAIACRAVRKCQAVKRYTTRRNREDR